MARIAAKLRSERWHIDPILAPDLSRLHTMIAAGLTHHGFVIQNSLRDALTTSRFLTVIDEPEVFISPIVDDFVQNNQRAACLNSQLAYEPKGRLLRPDNLVIDHRDGSATFYEMRRAASQRGAGKWWGHVLDTLALRVLAANYARSLGYRVTRGSAYLVAYYGGHRMPPELVLTRGDLDEHFSFPVTQHIEAATVYYRQALSRVLPLPGQVLEWLTGALDPA